MDRRQWICKACRTNGWSWRAVLARRFQGHSTVAGNGGGLLPAAVLSKAQSVTAEHARLTQELSQSFNSQVARRVGELTNVARAFKQWNESRDALAELQSIIDDPTTEAELGEIAADEIQASRAALGRRRDELVASLAPRHPFAHLGCLVEIRPGVGGSEAALFAGDLFRMYQALSARHGRQTRVMKFETAEGPADPAGSDAPLQEAILEIEGAGSYGAMRGEAGVHRVQRVPATETKGRTHTSAASVLVLPAFSGTGLSGDEAGASAADAFVDPKEVRTEIMRARGAGGQHVNKTESAVRLTHLPSGTTVSMQDGRSQHRNKEMAWRLLRARLAQARRQAREDVKLRLRRSVLAVARTGRGDKIRTYNWGQQRVTDHRTAATVHDLADVMRGGDALDRLMDGVRAWLLERELEDLAADTSEASIR